MMFQFPMEFEDGAIFICFSAMLEVIFLSSTWCFSKEAGPEQMKMTNQLLMEIREDKWLGRFCVLCDEVGGLER